VALTSVSALQGSRTRRRFGVGVGAETGAVVVVSPALGASGNDRS
jgi:hypothetical protein